MTPELAKLALQFLSRAGLQGSEVPAFAAVSAGLQAIAAGQLTCIEPGEIKRPKPAVSTGENK